MLSQDFSEYLSNLLESKIETIQSVSGGDISSAYLIQTLSKKFFLKVNDNSIALDMFKAEAKGLEAISNTNTIATPKVIAYNLFNSNSFLLMEYVDAKRATSKDSELLGKQLAQLHQVSSDEFGFDSNNFIGSLHQSNKTNKTWNDFYVEKRLIPQFALAKSKGLLNPIEIPNKELLLEKCHPFFKNATPSLLHGDLWSGNYLISMDGNPYLIDTATYFGHNEVDIAMSKLFGGFGQSFYDSYFEIIPKDELTDDRIQLYQLYYLLVHLNLFGSSYYSSVKQILHNYF